MCVNVSFFRVVLIAHSCKRPCGEAFFHFERVPLSHDEFRVAAKIPRSADGRDKSYTNVLVVSRDVTESLGDSKQAGG